MLRRVLPFTTGVLALCAALLPSPALAAPLCDGQPATVWGTSGNDVINVAQQLEAGEKSIVAGLGGNDTIVGTGRGDRICGGSGNDVIRGGGGGDRILGGSGRDRIDGGASGDVLLAEGGNDRVFGGRGDDSMNGGDGVDWVQLLSDGQLQTGGGDGDDRWGVDLATGEVRLLSSTATADDDTALLFENIIGSRGADRLKGNGKPNKIRALEGSDLVYGAGGADTLSGGDGYNTMRGEGGNDLLVGGPSRDTLDGGSGTDTGRGGAGFDTCRSIEERSGCDRLSSPSF